MTRIFHPNVSSSGEICVNTLKKDWKSTYGITHILTVIKCLLIYPNPESALDEEAGKMLLEDYAGFAKRAKLMTEVHAARVSFSHLYRAQYANKLSQGGKPTEFEDTKDEEDPLFSSEPLFGPSFADSAPSTSTSKPRATKSRTRQPSQPASDSPTISSVTLPASSSTPTAAITPSSAFISTSGSAPSAVPLQVSAQSNGAPPRSSPAPEKEGTNATTKKDASGKDKEQSGAKGKEALKTTGVGKTLKRPASAVSGGVKVEGGEKKKKGLKRL